MTQYHSKPVSEHGHIDWDLDEHAVILIGIWMSMLFGMS